MYATQTEPSICVQMFSGSWICRMQWPWLDYWDRKKLPFTVDSNKMAFCYQLSFSLAASTHILPFLFTPTFHLVPVDVFCAVVPEQIDIYNGQSWHRGGFERETWRKRIKCGEMLNKIWDANVYQGIFAEN